jgi:enterochelin esterase-like enzyme
MVTRSIPSALYGHPVAASVYLPPCSDAAMAGLPVIYLLHGANTDETQWPDLNVQSAADALIAQGAPPFVVVMPSGVYRQEVDYEQFVLNELIPASEDQLPVSRAASGRAIGGISLGGYWALKTAFDHPDQFAAAGGHSPVTTRTAGPEDPASLAGSATGLAGLRLWLDVGNFDSLRGPTTQLAHTLRARGLSLMFTVSHGSHDRPYWRSQTPLYLRFYVDALSGQDGLSGYHSFGGNAADTTPWAGEISAN